MQERNHSQQSRWLVVLLGLQKEIIKMIMHIFGTINKHIDVGYDKANDTIFIHASSNCINFTRDEMDCLLSVLTIVGNIPFDRASDFLSRKHIDLWEPAPPPAEIKIV